MFETTVGVSMFSRKRFMELVEASWPRLYRVAYSWTHDAHLSRDLVQEAVSRAIAKHKQLKDIEYLNPWLFRILSNCWMDVCRQKKYVEEWDESLPLQTQDTPEVQQHHREIKNRVHRAMSRLPMEQRQVVTLVDLEGFSYSEVAEIVNVPVGTVMSRLCRARNKLRTYLETEPVHESTNATVRRIK